MNIVIRTDASVEIGTGHVMRCLTLAKQLKRHGAEVTFVCRGLEGNSILYLQGEGMGVAVLPSIEGNFQWKLDAEATIVAIKEMNIEVDLVIVDHYGLDSNWENRLRRFTKKIMVIDDLADRPHDCDLLLDQNYYLNMQERYKELVPEHCIQMLGPDYVLLRDEFLHAANKPRERSGEINNILVFFGGTDPTGETIKTLKAFKEIKVSEIEINVVVGGTNPKRYEIEQMCDVIPNVKFYCQVSNMAKLMREADLAIGAGGATTWERCYLGLPSLTIVVAENQLELTKGASLLGTSINLGWSSEIGIKQLANSLTNVLDDPLQIKNMSSRCFKVMDHHTIRSYPVMKKTLEMCS